MIWPNMSWIRFHQFLHVQMIFIDILNTIEEKHCYEFLYCITTVLYQFDSFSQRVDLVDIKGHHYFLMLFFLWKI